MVLCYLHLQWVYALYSTVISNCYFAIEKTDSLTKLEISMRLCWQRCAQKTRSNSIVPGQDHQLNLKTFFRRDVMTCFFEEIYGRFVEAFETDETYALCIRMEVMVVSVSL